MVDPIQIRFLTIGVEISVCDSDTGLELGQGAPLWGDTAGIHHQDTAQCHQCPRLPGAGLIGPDGILEALAGLVCRPEQKLDDAT